ncbi:SAF domain-containing protein [uncultured Jatrophihabitans sp.]|uniref:SAF domain-containing protein n=1 Tax=uncultured Jatrophihabitans sp. TaxID=1610747 RepID=UPI0035CA208B
MLESVQALWLRVGRWPRLFAAGTCVLLAVGSAVGAARDRAAARAPARTVAVVVGTRALPAGHTLRAGDLRVVRWPASLHPPSTVADPRLLIGKRCSGALGRGEPVTAPRILGAGIAAGLSPGVGAVPIEVADERSADYVHAGTTIDVLAGPAPDVAGSGDTGSDDHDVQVVASRVTVLGVMPGGEGRPAVVLIAGDRATALRVARLQSLRTFTTVVIPP